MIITPKIKTLTKRMEADIGFDDDDSFHSHNNTTTSDVVDQSITAATLSSIHSEDTHSGGGCTSGGDAFGCNSYSEHSGEFGSPPTSERFLTNYHRMSSAKNVWDKKERTYIARLFVTFNECLSQLGGHNLTRRKMEEMAIFVHDSMSVGSRNYHSVQHLFDISKDLEDPLGIIGIMFHDCIYYHVDGGFSDVQRVYLKDVYQEEETRTEDGGTTKKLVFRAKPDDVDTKPLLALASTIFGYEQNQEVTVMKGLNEFLSAVVAVRMLHDHVDLEILAQVACCIEATIPFRNKYDMNDPSKNPFEKLYNNMLLAKNKFQLNLSDDELIKAVQLAVIIANEDVGNFGSTDHLYFLDNTWSLLPELNYSLRTAHLYTVKQFQEAMHKMNGFFNFLDPLAVFAYFRGIPTTETLNLFKHQAEINLLIGRKYVGAKYLSASILAAFAELTGGDVPVALLMGDLPSRRFESQKLEDSLPKHKKSIIKKHCNMLVYEILEDGRKTETAFDIKHSPLSAYLYGILGDKRLDEILSEQKMFPMDTERAESLLHAIPKHAVQLLARNISIVAVSRSEELRHLSENFYAKKKATT